MRKYLLSAILCIALCSGISAGSSPVYRQFVSGGKTLWYWVIEDERRDYNEQGNEIHFKYSDGYEGWSEYDEKGNLILSKDSDGFETWYEYEYYPYSDRKKTRIAYIRI